MTILYVWAARLPKIPIVLLAALLWVVSPIDLIPDSVPLIGVLDDAFIAILASINVQGLLADLRANS